MHQIACLKGRIFPSGNNCAQTCAALMVNPGGIKFALFFNLRIFLSQLAHVSRMKKWRALASIAAVAWCPWEMHVGKWTPNMIMIEMLDGNRV